MAMSPIDDAAIDRTGVAIVRHWMSMRRLDDAIGDAEIEQEAAEDLIAELRKQGVIT